MADQSRYESARHRFNDAVGAKEVTVLMDSPCTECGLPAAVVQQFRAGETVAYHTYGRCAADHTFRRYGVASAMPELPDPPEEG